jgi:hypothetical protein
MSDEKDEYDEVKGDIFSNIFHDPIADDSMQESLSLSLEIVLDVPIFDKYSDDEEDFKSCEGLLTTKISSSPTFQQRDDQIVSFETFKDEDQIASFEKLKNDEQIFISAYGNFESTTDPKGISQFQDLQRLEVCSRYEKEGEQLKSLDQQSKEIFLCEFDDPFAYYLELGSIDVKIFLSEEDCFYHLFKPLFCMIWIPLLFGQGLA